MVCVDNWLVFLGYGLGLFFSVLIDGSKLFMLTSSAIVLLIFFVVLILEITEGRGKKA